MGGAVAVGRLGGVAVRVHWSVVVIAGLLAWSLATQVLPPSYPEASGPAAWAAGCIAAGAFLLGLLAHEMTHAVIARGNGIRVEDITLWHFTRVIERSELIGPVTATPAPRSGARPLLLPRR